MGERRFPIRYDPDFRTGICGDGRQVLLGLHHPEVVAYFLGSDGVLVEVEACPVVTRVPDRGAYWDTDDPKFRAAIDGQIAAWLAESRWETRRRSRRGPRIKRLGSLSSHSAAGRTPWPAMAGYYPT